MHVNKVFTKTSTQRAITFRGIEELSTMFKNNLRGNILVRGPIWGIHSLTLIISWLQQILNAIHTQIAKSPNRT